MRLKRILRRNKVASSVLMQKSLVYQSECPSNAKIGFCRKRKCVSQQPPKSMGFFKLLMANVNNILGQSLSPGPLPENAAYYRSFCCWFTFLNKNKEKKKQLAFQTACIYNDGTLLICFMVNANTVRCWMCVWRDIYIRVCIYICVLFFISCLIV